MPKGVYQRKTTNPKMGRPTKLTPRLQERILRAVRSGCYLETATAAVGIRMETLRAWLKRGARSDGGMYRDFMLAVQVAMAQAEIRDLDRIDKAADPFTDADGKTSPGSWTAAAWRLERRHPERWALSPRIRAETERQMNVLLDRLEDRLPTEVYRQVLMVIRDIGREDSGSPPALPPPAATAEAEDAPDHT